MSLIRCRKCGTENPENSRFCMKCAAPLAPAPAPLPVETPATEKSSKPLSTPAFFLLMILFAIPVVGFVAAIVLAFAPENRNIKSFARAQILFSLFSLTFAVIAVFLMYSASFYPYPYLG